MSIYRRVLQYYRPFLGQTLIGLALSLCGIALNLLKPWPVVLKHAAIDRHGKL